MLKRKKNRFAKQNHWIKIHDLKETCNPSCNNQKERMKNFPSNTEEKNLKKILIIDKKFYLLKGKIFEMHFFL